ncbi:NAD(P)H-dependent oxidoreductase [Pseudomonas typographi]|uniref:NAD(P)H-dependent oxidoreductase n=1 Tax=Pseudomonas typographi TaxID=2715964 RepID=UPI001684CBEE|nr:NAD(P)H-dependent oxidoreductase [Pseudomonas typographi]MBD1588934.1 FMN reductase [Pseudomonas typographi]
MIIALAANTYRPSKTRALLDELVSQFRQLSDVPIEAFDLAQMGRDIGGSFSKQELTAPSLALVEAIENADGLIVTSPVYKGSYSGLFKHLFDLVAPLSLRNTPVLLSATGGGQRHALMVEHQMRPLFGFFSAATVPTSVYGCDLEFIDGRCADPTLLERCAQAVGEFHRMCARGRA